jgi:hypothetical protein
MNLLETQLLGPCDATAARPVCRLPACSRRRSSARIAQWRTAWKGRSGGLEIEEREWRLKRGWDAPLAWGCWEDKDEKRRDKLLEAVKFLPMKFLEVPRSTYYPYHSLDFLGNSIPGCLHGTHVWAISWFNPRKMIIPRKSYVSLRFLNHFLGNKHSLELSKFPRERKKL